MKNQLLCDFQGRSRPRLNLVETAAAGEPQLRVGRESGRPFLQLSYRRVAEDPERVTLILDLPVVAVTGRPETVSLDVRGDGRCAWGFLDGADREGWGFSYELGLVDFTGWKTITVDARKCDQKWGEKEGDEVIPPLQLYRLGFILPSVRDELDLGLAALGVSGRCRLVRGGVATVAAP